MSSRVKIALIGLGDFGSVLARAVAGIEGLELAKCYARSRERREEFAMNHDCDPAADLDDIWLDDDLQGVLIATPHSTHEAMLLDAVRAGKDAFIEKPLTLTGVEADRVVEAAENKGSVLQVGHNRRRQTALREIRRHLDEGELGALLGIVANMSGPFAYRSDLPEWRKSRDECPAGALTPMGVHVIDNIGYIGGNIVSVQALTRRVAGVLPIDDVTMVQFELGNGGIAQMATMSSVPFVSQVAVFGTEINMWSENDGHRLFKQARSEATRSEMDIEPIDTVQDQLREFKRCIETRDSPETDGRVGARVVHVVDAILQSHSDSGRCVRVQD